VDSGVALDGLLAGFAVVWIAAFVVLTPVGVFRVLRTLLSP
jgi:hypothetical protein